MAINDSQWQAGASLPSHDEYLQLRSLFLGALADMARFGAAASPNDGLDLIHEFIVEQLPGMRQRFDASKSKFTTYVYRAFVLFARRQILELNRWKSGLRHFAEWEEEEAASQHGSVEESDHETWSAADLTIVRNAISRLSPLHQQALRLYLAESGRSERQIAAKMTVSRYAVRKLLAESVLQVATWIGEQGSVADEDWRIALARWRHGMNLKDLAGSFGISVSQVKQSGKRAAAMLSKGLGAKYSARSEKRNEFMGPIELLVAALSHPGNRELLRELELRKDEILEELQKETTGASQFDAVVTEDFAWVSEVYAALAGAEELEPEDKEVLKTLWEFRDADAVSVGKSFKNGLVRDLPEELLDWSAWFGNAVNIGSEGMGYLLQRPDVDAARPAIEPLLNYGITPLSLSAATQAVRAVSDRLVQQKKLSGHSIILSADDSLIQELDGMLPPMEVTKEMSALADLPVRTAAAMFSWIVALAKERSFIFPGFHAMSESDYIRLNRQDGELTLQERWESPQVPVGYGQTLNAGYRSPGGMS